MILLWDRHLRIRGKLCNTMRLIVPRRYRTTPGWSATTEEIVPVETLIEIVESTTDSTRMGDDGASAIMMAIISLCSGSRSSPEALRSRAELCPLLTGRLAMRFEQLSRGPKSGSSIQYATSRMSTSVTSGSRAILIGIVVRCIQISCGCSWRRG